MLAAGGGGGNLKKIFRTYQKKFQDISHFFLNMKKIFRIYLKILRKYDIFQGKEKHFQEITYIQVFKSALWAKNAILMTFFTQEKGMHFAPEKRALGETWGEAGPPWPPRFLHPCIWEIKFNLCTCKNRW